MKFDRRRADRAGRFDRLELRFDEQRHDDAGAAQFGHEWSQMVVTADHVEAAFGGALGAPLRHQARGMRFDRECDVEHLLGRRHFEIERLRNGGLDPRHIFVADVTAVFAQMRGDAIGAGVDGEFGGAQRIRHVAAARIAQSRDMIDVDAKAQPR